MTEQLKIPLVGDVQALMRRLAGITTDDQSNNTIHTEPFWEWLMITSATAAAADRFHGTVGSRPILESRAAVGEALWWIAAADEYLQRTVSPGLGRRQYYSSLGATRSGRLLGALSFLRNRAGHQMALVLSHHGTTEPVTFQVLQDDGSTTTESVVGSYTWQPNPHQPAEADFVFTPVGGLPPADTAHSERYGREAWYEEEVALKAVGPILDDIAAVLAAAFTFGLDNPRRVSVQVHLDLTSVDRPGSA